MVAGERCSEGTLRLQAVSGRLKPGLLDGSRRTVQRRHPTASGCLQQAPHRL